MSSSTNQTLKLAAGPAAVKAAARRFAAGGGGRTAVAPVHSVDNGGIGLGQVSIGVTLANGAKVVQVFRHNGEFPSSKSSAAVMHERAIIVWLAEISSSTNSIEIVSHVAWDVLEEDLDVLVPVRSALLVMEADGVTELVCHNSCVSTASCLERYLVRAMVVADGRVATLAAEDCDVVIVSSRSSF